MNENIFERIEYKSKRFTSNKDFKDCKKDGSCDCCCKDKCKTCDKKEDERICPYCEKPMKVKIVERDDGNIREEWYRCGDCKIRGHVISSYKTYNHSKKQIPLIPWRYFW